MPESGPCSRGDDSAGNRSARLDLNLEYSAQPCIAELSAEQRAEGCAGARSSAERRESLAGRGDFSAARGFLVTAAAVGEPSAEDDTAGSGETPVGGAGGGAEAEESEGGGAEEPAALDDLVGRASRFAQRLAQRRLQAAGERAGGDAQAGGRGSGGGNSSGGAGAGGREGADHTRAGGTAGGSGEGGVGGSGGDSGGGFQAILAAIGAGGDDETAGGDGDTENECDNSEDEDKEESGDTSEDSSSDDSDDSDGEEGEGEDKGESSSSGESSDENDNSEDDSSEDDGNAYGNQAGRGSEFWFTFGARTGMSDEGEAEAEAREGGARGRGSRGKRKGWVSRKEAARAFRAHPVAHATRVWSSAHGKTSALCRKRRNGGSGGCGGSGGSGPEEARKQAEMGALWNFGGTGEGEGERGEGEAKGEKRKGKGEKRGAERCDTVNVHQMLLSREVNVSKFGRFSESDRCHLAQSFLPCDGPMVVDKVASRAYIGQFSGDGDLFVAGFQDRRIRVYDVDRGWALRKDVIARNLRWTITDTALSPDQRFLVYASITPIVHLVNVGYGSGEVESLANVTDIHEELNFTAVESRRRERSFGIWSLQFSSDGRELIAGSSDRSLYVFDLERNQPILRDDVNAVAFADETSQLIYSGSDDRICKVWDRRLLDNTEPIGPLRLLDPVGPPPFSHSAGGAASAASSAAAGAAGAGAGAGAAGVGLSLDGLPREGNEGRTPQRPWDYRWMDYPGRGMRVAHPSDQSLMTYRNHHVLQTLIRCYFSPLHSTAQRFVYSGSHDGAVYIFDLLTGKQVAKLKHHGSTVRDCSWHPTRPALASVGWDGKVAVWESFHGETPPECKKMRQIPCKGGGAGDGAGTGGMRPALASVGWDGKAALWESFHGETPPECKKMRQIPQGILLPLLMGIAVAIEEVGEVMGEEKRRWWGRGIGAGRCSPLPFPISPPFPAPVLSASGKAGYSAVNAVKVGKVRDGSEAGLAKGEVGRSVHACMFVFGWAA
ncbi:unnamed protein product [Closterium sp. Naga37s-1]|nr:unnamed protein product [Closterium sp. Naga37s-1]